MTNVKNVVFAHGYVGRRLLEYLLAEFANDLFHVVLMDHDIALYETLTHAGVQPGDITWNSNIYSNEFLYLLENNDISWIILAWWPTIIKAPLFSKTRFGILNLHPSYLPFNRGKDPNFWTIVEDTEFGVSLHLVDESIDGGDIVAQKTITKFWTDTGETLYKRAITEILTLFRKEYNNIRCGNIHVQTRDNNPGTLHWRKQLEPESEIFLDKEYKGRDLLNLLRARTFPPHPAAWFEDAGRRYEVRVSISEKTWQ